MSPLYIIIFALFLAAVIGIPVFGGFGKRSKSGSSRFGNTTPMDKSFVQQKWNEIEVSSSQGTSAHLKVAVMEADKLVEYVLSATVRNGNTFAEKLKSARPKFKNYDDYNNLWFAHKVRNSIAHDNGVDFSITNAKKAVDYFKKALKILGAL